MHAVPVVHRAIDDYRSVVPNDAINGLHRRAWEIAGKSVLHLNSTAFGGGVAELLLAQVPLLQDLGVKAEWRVVDGDDEFFAITKSIHNGLQGNHELEWTDSMVNHYLDVQERNAKELEGPYDVVIVHDPQPLAIPKLLGSRQRDVAKHWIWRCHIDAQNPHPAIWRTLREQLDVYDAVVFTMKEFAQEDIPVERVVISPPSIDPMSPKNSPLAPITVTDVCQQYGMDPRRQIIAQVSRFDPWKDPLGVMEAYRAVKEEFPQVQLIMAGSLAHDDPEGLVIYEEVLQARRDDPDVYVLSNFQEVGNNEINCFQRAAQVVIQKSIREGFGLTVAEAAWKGKPMVAGRTGGITIQVEDGKTGFLVGSVAECADRVIDLLSDPQRAAQMGEAGRELIRAQFLTPRELADWLELICDLVRS